MSLEVIAIGSDNLVRLDGLNSASTGSYINSATVTFTLTDSSGAVVNSLQNIAMPFVSGKLAFCQQVLAHA